jgi:hypothetical protein
MMSIIIGDICFSLRDAAIYGNLADSKGVPPGLSWYLEVQTETQPVKVSMEDEDPIEEEMSADLRLSCEFESDPMRRWLELEGKTVHSNMAEGQQFPAAFSYFETHEYIPYSTLKFVKRTGNKFQIHWEGKCNPVFGEPYNSDVPFLIQTEATFKEISVHVNPRDTEATVLARLSEYLDPSDFIQHPIKEMIVDIPFEYIDSIFEKGLRRLFNCPKCVTTRSSIFEPRI